jgi:hypothetical protein
MWCAAAATYQKSLIKAVTRTMEEGRYTLVILDAPNLRVDDFRDAMAAAQVLHMRSLVKENS